ncbi:nucleoside 2-deoxyribosyltransferase [Oenococcus sicerae]|uniref:Nucleoside 2-deoxyribosyltransferase n=1 Tax=Oenococcus sicerae TaxID=2203724 RepID=A0AAJ1VPZ9_9LACO|nr:nucleoside 2-deoxyribosyltransferase [Oenococcus sicerae]MDN6899617.1 nucleoside 2-deoxyribosyltransferase [Oenococcus sicerae]QAS70304.1 nucleoside 2-deoxyribosyltransferase [Oenococcus sicerae]VDK14952.1 Nucleoside deoxyribosyltransferase [Oenococcus sicerae]
MNKVYFACSWFSDSQTAYMKQGISLIEQNKTVDWQHSFYPLDHQYKGLAIPDHPELLEDTEWQLATFNGDVNGINTSDLIAAMYLPDQPDEGIAWELGYAYAIHKPTLLIVPSGVKQAVNLMPAMGATKVITIDDLKNFDFDQIVYAPYKGQVY